MKPMLYKSSCEKELLDRGTYREHEYFVISLGTHPCAYVKLNNENAEMAKGVNCHGCVTYYDKFLDIGDTIIKGNIIGWDYAHYGDYMGFYDDMVIYDDPVKKYTTEEIVSECHRVIDDLIEMFN